MKININWKKTLLIMADLIIGVYLVFAVTSWNKPAEKSLMCTKVDINIEDENENGFLKTAEVKGLLEKRHLYPLSKHIDEIDIREIEEELTRTAFVKTAQCCITQEGHVCISLTQRTPIIRVKADNGDDYYIDDNGGVMPNSQYTSDMIIVTGSVTRQYACAYISIMARCIMNDELWRNQIEQVNILRDRTIEIVPRVGDHIINIGQLPSQRNVEKRKEEVSEFVKKQFHRLELFYKYGLSNSGWNKYSYISFEFANQVICTKREELQKEVVQPVIKLEETDAITEVPAQEEKKEDNKDKKKQ
ncbi:MAG: cell division protein FtsQ [Prevotella sp.]|nr:cell division protein FtsQ [Prevotella sp.]